MFLSWQLLRVCFLFLVSLLFLIIATYLSAILSLGERFKGKFSHAGTEVVLGADILLWLLALRSIYLAPFVYYEQSLELICRFEFSVLVPGIWRGCYGNGAV